MGFDERRMDNLPYRWILDCNGAHYLKQKPEEKPVILQNPGFSTRVVLYVSIMRAEDL